MNKLQHVMLDLETLASSSNAVVVSIGAVRFDPYSKYAIGDTFYMEFNVASQRQQQETGGFIDPKTLEWWSRQDALARRILSELAVPWRQGTQETLEKFTEFMNAVPDTYLWGNGADFDNVVLGNLYGRSGYTKPWSYSNNRCYRSFKRLDGAPRLLQHFGTAHHARDDAITQAQHLQEIFAWLKLSRPAESK